MILTFAGLWAVLVGRITLWRSLRLQGRGARIYGAVLTLFASFFQPLITSLLLRWLPVSLSGNRTVTSVGFLICNLAVSIVILIVLAKLVHHFFPPKEPSQRIQVIDVLIILGALLFVTAGFLKIRQLVFPKTSLTASAEEAKKWDLPGVTHQFSDRIKNLPDISSDVGTPVKVFLVPRSLIGLEDGSVSADFSAVGPKGKGRCSAIYIPAAKSPYKKDTHILTWTFNGQSKTLPPLY